MSEEKVYLKEGFFKFLVSLEELKEMKEKIIFVRSIGITDDAFLLFTQYLLQFDVVVKYDESYVYPLKENQKIHLDLNVSEWFALQATLGTSNEVNPYFHKLLKNKIEEVQKAHSRFNLYRSISLDNLDQKTTKDPKNIIKKLDQMIFKKVSAKINFTALKFCEIFPLRLVFLDGILCIVGEEIHDKNLSYFAVEDIWSVTDCEIDYETHISQIEVNEFIGHIRLINGNEERLILKIFSPGESDLLPKNHYLGNPFVTSNPEGDMIWAASLEMCEDIYEWLYQMKNHVEVLDPGHIRKEFAHYCECKKSNSDNKKAS